MTVNQGFKSLAESQPNFSNQAIENSVNDVMKGWATKTQTLDTAIENNTVLTVSQKNDLKDTINNISYINVGRYTGDLIRHTQNLLNGSLVILANPEVEDSADFLETLQLAQSFQTTIPAIFDKSAEEISRGIDDHFGTLRRVLSSSEDSAQSVMDSLKEAITMIDSSNKPELTTYGNACDALTTFLAEIHSDSTDFQQTLNTFASTVATASTAIDTTALTHEPYLTMKDKMIDAREKINVQVALENRNLADIRTFATGITSYFSYQSLADDKKLADIMAKTSENVNWQDYFENFASRKANLNPLYRTNTDSDKTSVIEQILKDQGLPDVLDYVDLNAVAKKATNNIRINTAGFDLKTTEQIITECCTQLNITTTNVSIYAQSKTLLNNLNIHDRQQIADALDLNESANNLT